MDHLKFLLLILIGSGKGPLDFSSLHFSRVISLLGFHFFVLEIQEKCKFVLVLNAQFCQIFLIQKGGEEIMLFMPCQVRTLRLDAVKSTFSVRFSIKYAWLRFTSTFFPHIPVNLKRKRSFGLLLFSIVQWFRFEYDGHMLVLVLVVKKEMERETKASIINLDTTFNKKHRNNNSKTLIRGIQFQQ